MQSLGATIRELRKSKGLTQRQLADQVGINSTYLSKIENDNLEGGQTPRVETLKLLGQALDGPVETLCLLAGKIPPSITERVLSAPHLFERIAWLDNSTVRTMLADLDEDKRGDVEEVLARANNFLQGVLDALTTHIAVLDATGTILAVNRAWSSFASANGLNDDGCGSNYFAVCDSARGHSSDNAQVVADNLRELVSGTRATYELEYPCHSKEEQRWFLMRASRFEHNGDVRVVVAHDKIIVGKQFASLAAVSN